MRVYPTNQGPNFTCREFDKGGYLPECSCALTVSCVHYLPAAMNYQTDGDPMTAHQAFFAYNGHCGYNLKPECMLDGEL